MARITIVIEDLEEGASVKWESDTGFLHENGTQAEQTAFYLLMLLADTHDLPAPTVKIGEGENN